MGVSYHAPFLGVLAAPLARVFIQQPIPRLPWPAWGRGTCCGAGGGPREGEEVLSQERRGG